MRDFLNLGLRLMAIGLIAGLCLGGTYMLTKEPIEKLEAEQAETARREVMAEADRFEQAELSQEQLEKVSSLFLAYQGEECIGYIVNTSQAGYKSIIILTVGVDLEGTITGVRISSSDETAGLGANINKESFYKQYDNTKAPLAVTKDGGTIEAVTSATISSRAVTDAVNAAAAFAAAYEQ